MTVLIILSESYIQNKLTFDIWGVVLMGVGMLPTARWRDGVQQISYGGQLAGSC